MKRVLLKLSGEALAGEKKTGFDEPTVMKVAEQVKTLVDQGIEVGIVIGGGNFWRGRSSENIDRTKADQIGMLATVMNCIYVSEIFRAAGMKTAVMTPFACGAFTELFSKDRVKQCFAEQSIDGVYDSDPKDNPAAKKYDEISIQEVIDKKLGVVDMTASILCMEQKMPMLVFGLNGENSIVNTVSGTFNGTRVNV